MDADARKLLELLRPAVERAEEIGVQQQALLLRQEESAEEFSTQIAAMTHAAEQERERLLQARSEFAALREAEVARGKEEAQAIVAAARSEAAAAHAHIEALRLAQVQREAEHASQMAQAERERAEAEALYLERLRQRESEHEARVAQLQARGLESVAERERSFEAACVDERVRLQALAVTEAEIQARVAEMRRLAIADGPDAFVELRVGGRMFETTIGCLTRFPQSVLATLWHQHRTSNDREGPVRIDGDPSLFHLILNYLRRGKLPIVTDVSQLQWLEAEAEEYCLNGKGELADLCRDAHKRLDTFKVMQLLNGQRNLSGMDMRQLDLSDIDFRGASMYRARADEADLSDAMLSGADTNLRHASFCRADAARAQFGEAQLEEAKLCGATLTQACFANAVAPKADFGKADLSDARLKGAKLAGASFVDAVAPRADFSFADLSLCDLKGADLNGAEMRATILKGALNLRFATFDNLRGAILDGVDLAGVDLGGKDLSGAKIAGAVNLRAATFDNLRGAILDGVDLAGVDLGGKDLSGAKFEGAIFIDPVQARGANVSSFPAGSMSSVREGSIVLVGEFIVQVSGNHPQNPTHAYYKSYGKPWDDTKREGYFKKDSVRLLA